MTALVRVTNKQRTPSLVDQFHEFFDVDFASSQQQKNAVYGLRYRVYCEEQHYEPADRFPDRMERDEFDAKSLHCLITHRASGIHAGCVRLVGTGGRRESDSLPYEKYCPDSVEPDFFRARGLRRENICEISRLAVDRRFRRRPGVTAEPARDSEWAFSAREIRAFPLISTAGFLAATALTEITRRTDVFALMEPFLPRLMRTAGFVFQRAGKDVHYHGIRAAYFCKTEWAVNQLRPELRALYDMIYQRIDQSYRVMDGWSLSDGRGVAATAGRGNHLRVVGTGRLG